MYTAAGTFLVQSKGSRKEPLTALTAFAAGRNHQQSVCYLVLLQTCD